MTLIRTNATNTPVTVEGPNGVIYEIGTAEPYHSTNDKYNLSLGDQFYTTATSGKEFTVNVMNLAPGEYVELQAVITNNGTVGFIGFAGVLYSGFDDVVKVGAGDDTINPTVSLFVITA